MKKAYDKAMQEKLKTDYHLDIISDVILNQPRKIIFFADTHSKKPIELEVIFGSLKMLGLEDKSSITLDSLVEMIDDDHAYAKVGGRKAYIKGLHEELYSLKSETYLTFPIRTPKGKYWLRYNMVQLKQDPNLFSVFVIDVTKHLSTDEEIFMKTHVDALTGVFNKYTLDYHYGLRYKLDNFHVLFLDIDNFKQFNDIKGHEYGDRFLKEFSNILKDYEGEFNLFYRIGGDEFIGLFFETPAKIKAMAEAILKRVRKLAASYEVSETSLSIGIVQAKQSDDVIRKADKVLYKAKDKGKDQYIYEVES